jgi:hypothetical protein
VAITFMTILAMYDNFAVMRSPSPATSPPPSVASVDSPPLATPIELLLPITRSSVGAMAFRVPCARDRWERPPTSALSLRQQIFSENEKRRKDQRCSSKVRFQIVALFVLLQYFSVAFFERELFQRMNALLVAFFINLWCQIVFFVIISQTIATNTNSYGTVYWQQSVGLFVAFALFLLIDKLLARRKNIHMLTYIRFSHYLKIHDVARATAIILIILNAQSSFNQYYPVQNTQERDCVSAITGRSDVFYNPVSINCPRNIYHYNWTKIISLPGNGLCTADVFENVSARPLSNSLS